MRREIDAGPPAGTDLPAVRQAYPASGTASVRGFAHRHPVVMCRPVRRPFHDRARRAGSTPRAPRGRSGPRSNLNRCDQADRSWQQPLRAHQATPLLASVTQAIPQNLPENLRSEIIIESMLLNWRECNRRMPSLRPQRASQERCTTSLHQADRRLLLLGRRRLIEQRRYYSPPSAPASATPSLTPLRRQVAGPRTCRRRPPRTPLSPSDCSERRARCAHLGDHLCLNIRWQFGRHGAQRLSGIPKPQSPTTDPLRKPRATGCQIGAALASCRKQGDARMIRATKVAVMMLAALTLIAGPADGPWWARWWGTRWWVAAASATNCGCKGGPGWRAPDGKCVGHRNITKLCGSPPSKRWQRRNCDAHSAGRP